jgi:hypothetical protein
MVIQLTADEIIEFGDSISFHRPREVWVNLGEHCAHGVSDVDQMFFRDH